MSNFCKCCSDENNALTNPVENSVFSIYSTVPLTNSQIAELAAAQAAVKAAEDAQAAADAKAAANPTLML